MYPKSQRDKFNALLFFQEARNYWSLLEVVKSHNPNLMQWRLSKGRRVKAEHINDPNIQLSFSWHKNVLPMIYFRILQFPKDHLNYRLFD
jgi:hypothetical protein